MAWQAYIPGAMAVGGAALGNLFGGQEGNIDKSPGLQEDYKRTMWNVAEPTMLSLTANQPRMTDDLGVSPLTLEGMASMQQAADGMQPMIDQAQQAWGFGLSAPDVANNPYVQDMLDALAAESDAAYGRQLARLGREGVGTGMYGGGRQGVRGAVLGGEIDRNRQMAAAQTALGAYGQGLSHQANLLGMSPQMASLGFLPGKQLIEAGAQDQAARTAELGAQMSRGQAVQNFALNPAERYIGMLGGQPGLQAAPQYHGTSGTSAGLGAGLALGGLFQTAQNQGLFDNLWGNKPLVTGPTGQGGYSGMTAQQMFPNTMFQGLQ